MTVFQLDRVPEAALQANQNVIRDFAYSKKVGNYLIGASIGHGSFAKVKEAVHTETGEKVAVKIIDKEKCKSDSYVRRNLRREGRILQQLRHRHIIQLFEILETEHCYYLVMEVCGEDLMANILQKKRLSEDQARVYVGQLVLAVEYLHKAGVLHRDLKVENILLSSKDNIKVIDFGLSTQVQTYKTSNNELLTDLCRTQCGSPAYAAPEVLAKKPYGHKADIWSIGVNMFAMLVGSLPFSVQPFNIRDLCNKMLNKDMNPIPVTISKQCLDLLHRFLEPDPEYRISLKEALKHPWLRDGLSCIGSPTDYPNPLRGSDIHPEITQYMVKEMGVCRMEITRHLLGNVFNSKTATYHLLVTKVKNYFFQRGLNTRKFDHVPHNQQLSSRSITMDENGNKCTKDDDDLVEDINADDSKENMSGKLPISNNVSKNTVTSQKKHTFLTTSPRNHTEPVTEAVCKSGKESLSEAPRLVTQNGNHPEISTDSRSNKNVQNLGTVQMNYLTLDTLENSSASSAHRNEGNHSPIMITRASTTINGSISKKPSNTNNKLTVETGTVSPSPNSSVIGGYKSPVSNSIGRKSPYSNSIGRSKSPQSNSISQYTVSRSKSKDKSSIIENKTKERKIDKEENTIDKVSTRIIIRTGGKSILERRKTARQPITSQANESSNADDCHRRILFASMNRQKTDFGPNGGLPRFRVTEMYSINGTGSAATSQAIAGSKTSPQDSTRQPLEPLFSPRTQLPSVDRTSNAYPNYSSNTPASALIPSKGRSSVIAPATPQHSRRHNFSTSITSPNIGRGNLRNLYSGPYQLTSWSNRPGTAINSPIQVHNFNLASSAGAAAIRSIQDSTPTHNTTFKTKSPGRFTPINRSPSNISRRDSTDINKSLRPTRATSMSRGTVDRSSATIRLSIDRKWIKERPGVTYLKHEN